MNIPGSDAKGQLTDLVKRAEHGEDIILTRHGRARADRIQDLLYDESGLPG